MSDIINFTLDGKKVQGKKGQTIMEAADINSVYIPRLCFLKEMSPIGSCRVCIVSVNGRFQPACSTPLGPHMNIEVNHPKLDDIRKAMIEMLFVEGNHFCPSCEKSGECDLQALAYRLQMMVPRFPFLFQNREVNALHPDIFFDDNRCIKCRRCVCFSRNNKLDRIFKINQRGAGTKIELNYTHLQSEETSRVFDVCPVGAIVIKKTAYRIPIGKRRYDNKPIGYEIENKEGITNE